MKFNVKCSLDSAILLSDCYYYIVYTWYTCRQNKRNVFCWSISILIWIEKCTVQNLFLNVINVSFLLSLSREMIFKQNISLKFIIKIMQINRIQIIPFDWIHAVRLLLFQYIINWWANSKLCDALRKYYYY